MRERIRSGVALRNTSSGAPCSTDGKRRPREGKGLSQDHRGGKRPSPDERPGPLLPVCARHQRPSFPKDGAPCSPFCARHQQPSFPGDGAPAPRLCPSPAAISPGDGAAASVWFTSEGPQHLQETRRWEREALSRQPPQARHPQSHTPPSRFERTHRPSLFLCLSGVAGSYPKEKQGVGLFPSSAVLAAFPFCLLL